MKPVTTSTPRDADQSGLSSEPITEPTKLEAHVKTATTSTSGDAGQSGLSPEPTTEPTKLEAHVKTIAFPRIIPDRPDHGALLTAFSFITLGLAFFVSYYVIDSNLIAHQQARSVFIFIDLALCMASLLLFGLLNKALKEYSRFKLTLGTSLILIPALFFVVFARGSLDVKSADLKSTDLLLSYIFPLISSGLAGALFLLEYAAPGFGMSKADYSIYSPISTALKIGSEIFSISGEAEGTRRNKTGRNRIPESEQGESVAALRGQIDLLKNRHSVLSQRFQQKIKELKQENQDYLIDGRLARARLLEEIKGISRRGTINLILGLIATMGGIYLLGSSLFESKQHSINSEELINHYAPRITFAVFIEITSFFFLRIYKSTIDEIKHFQNEITNIEMKTMALRAAINFYNAPAAEKIMSELATTERNRILKKGETTIEIEKERVAFCTGDRILSAAENILGDYKKKTKVLDKEKNDTIDKKDKSDKSD